MEIPANTLKRVVQMLDSGFYMIPKWVARDPTMTPAAKLVYSVLWTRKNGQNVAWPGQDYIASNTGLATRTVRKAIADLEKANLIKVNRRGLGKTNEYELVHLSEKLGIKLGTSRGKARDK